MLQRFVALLILLCLSCGMVQAQLNVNLVIPPQMPERVPAWTEEMNSQIQVIISNPTRESYAAARISVTVHDIDRGRTIFQTKDNDPAMPRFTIPAGGTVTRFARDIINRRAISYDASIERVIMTTNSIPEGSYEFCVSVIDQSGMPLTAQERICRNFSITIPDPPTLISPANGESLQRELLPSFSWTPATGGAPGSRVQYRLRLVPVFRGQTPQMALRSNPVLLDKSVQGTTYQYLPSDTRMNTFSDAIGFAWEVQSVRGDNDRIAFGRNEGRSEIFAFAFRQESKNAGATTSPTVKDIGKATEKKKVPDFSEPSTIPTSTLTGRLIWSFRKSESLSSPSVLMGATAINLAAVKGDGSTKSATIGSRLSPINKATIESNADAQQYPLANVSVRLYADVPLKTFAGGKGRTESVCIGSARTDASGKFSLSFITPTISLSSAGGYTDNDVQRLADSIRAKRGSEAAKKFIENEIGKRATSVGAGEQATFKSITARLEVDAGYNFLFAPYPLLLQENTTQSIDAGNLQGLARSFRLQCKALDMQGKSIPDTALRVEVFRATSWYAQHDYAKKEGDGSQNPTATIAGVPCVRVGMIKGGMVLPRLFVHQSGSAEDKYFLRVMARYDKNITLDTLLSFLSVDEAAVSNDGIINLTKQFDLSLHNRSIVRGRVLTPEKENLNHLISPGVVPVALVPFNAIGLADTSLLIRTLCDVQSGEFIFDNVKPGNYYLQVGGAKKYLSTLQDDKYAFYGAILQLYQPKIVDTTIIIETALTSLVGRLVDDIGNPVKGSIGVQNGAFNKVYPSDDAGAFSLAMRYGTNDVVIRSKGHTDTSFTLVLTPDEAFGVPEEITKEIQEKIQKALEKAAKEKRVAAEEQNPLAKKDWGKMKERDMFELWAKGIMETETMKQTHSQNGDPLQSYSPIQAGYTSGNSRFAGANIKQNNGSLYTSGEVAAFGSAYMELFGSGTMNVQEKSFGKDAIWERMMSPEDALTPAIVDMGSVSLRRRTKLTINVAELLKTGGGSGKFDIKATTVFKGIEKATVAIEGVTTLNSVQNISKKTDKDGNATLTNILPGTLTVRVTPPQGSYFVPQLADVTVGAFKDSTTTTIILEHGGGIKGIVKDDKGVAIEGARVRASYFDELMIETTTNSKGEYQLLGVPPLSLRSFTATKDGYIGETKMRPVLVDSITPNVDFTLKKTAFTISKLYGFPVEVESYDEAKKTVNGAFVKIPSNNTFSITPQTRLPFKKLEISIENGVAKGSKADVDLPLVADMELRAFSKIPLRIKNIMLHQRGSSQSGVFSSTSQSATPDWDKYMPLGSLPYSIENKSEVYCTSGDDKTRLDLFTDDASAPVSGNKLTLKSINTLKLKLWTTALNVGLNKAFMDESGIHFKGEGALPGSVVTQGKNIEVTEVHIKPSGAIGTVSVSFGDALKKSFGGFAFTLNALAITEKGISAGGTLNFGVADLLQASNIPVSSLMLNSDGVSGGSFDVENAAITLLNKYSLSRKGASGFGLELQSNNGVYTLSSEQISIEKTKYFDKGMSAKFSVSSDGKILLFVAANFSADFFKVASVNVNSLSLNTEKKQLDLDGSLKLDIKNVAAFEGAGFHFKSNGNVDIDKLSATINVGPAQLGIKDLSFGENVSKPDFTKGKDAAAECDWSGFSTSNVSLSIPGTPIDLNAGFYYLRCEGKGIAFGAKFTTGSVGIPIVIGPATVTIKGGGFEANTADQSYSITAYSAVSVTGAEKVVAFDPTTMTIGLAAGSPYIKATTTVAMFPQTSELKKDLGEAEMMLNFGQKYLMVNVTVSDYEMIPGVPVNGSLHIEAQIDGGNSYFWAGIQCSVSTLGGLVNGNAALILGVNVPIDKIQANYRTALYDGATTGKFTGISTRAGATIGVPYEKRKCIDVELCDACVWCGATADAQMYVDFSQGFTKPAFGFAFNAAWSAGAKCGCVGASAGLGGGLAGGYNKPQYGGWYFSGRVAGEFEFCIGFCVHPSIGVNMSYSQNKGFDFSLD